jgi:hypothetical protein
MAFRAVPVIFWLIRSATALVAVSFFASGRRIEPLSA